MALSASSLSSSCSSTITPLAFTCMIFLCTCGQRVGSRSSPAVNHPIHSFPSPGPSPSVSPSPSPSPSTPTPTPTPTPTISLSPAASPSPSPLSSPATNASSASRTNASQNSQQRERGRKVGLAILFIAGGLQAFVVFYLFLKRKQMLKLVRSYELNGSSQQLSWSNTV